MFCRILKIIYKIGENDWRGEDNTKLKCLEVAGGVKRKSQRKELKNKRNRWNYDLHDITSVQPFLIEQQRSTSVVFDWNLLKILLLKMSAFNGNLERKVIKGIQVKLCLDQNLTLDQLSLNNVLFTKMDQIYLRAQYSSDRIVL